MRTTRSSTVDHGKELSRLEVTIIGYVAYTKTLQMGHQFVIRNGRYCFIDTEEGERRGNAKYAFQESLWNRSRSVEPKFL